VGINNFGIISNSYSTGSVNGAGNNIGGLVGYNNSSGIISNSYSTGSVNGTSYVGGLVGYNNNYAVISNSYSTGSVSGTSNIGGLAGYNRIGTISNSYYNSGTSGQSDNDGRGLPRTTAEMTYPYDVTSTTTYVGWDFDNIWYHDTTSRVNNGYPYNRFVDIVDPTITILGSNPASVFKGSSYTDEGATAVDDIDGDITNNIIVTNNVDTSNIGTYSVIYEVSDTAGNTVSSTRIVSVVSAPGSTIPPYILESMNNNQNTNTSTSTEQSNNENNNQIKDNNITQISGTGSYSNTDFIKTKNISTVYFLDTNNIRHIYPSEAIWYSYFGSDFSNVYTLNDNQKIEDYRLGKNVVFKKGTLMKLLSVPKVYLVGDNGLIRWIKTEEKAIELYGKNWNKLVYDLDESLFGDYIEGIPIE